jgi:hypothetical protein
MGNSVPYLPPDFELRWDDVLASDRCDTRRIGRRDPSKFAERPRASRCSDLSGKTFKLPITRKG